MREDIINIKNEALAQIFDAKSDQEIEEIRITYLGRKGKVALILSKLKDLPKEDRKRAGLSINETKKAIEEAINEADLKFVRNKTYSQELFDLSIPGNKPSVGHLHPQTQVLNEIVDIFTYLGYQVTDGPEIETDYYNFEALNFLKDHPARDTQQTLFIDTSKTKIKFGELILRTQTSAMQGRVMERTKPPFRVLVPGKCFRYEQVDASHGFEFWQAEGFVVDENIHLTDLFGTIDFVIKRIFGKDSKIRFATTNFPFVEPGVDTYLECTICNGRGCSFCKNTGWSEIMPAGMIHPNVLAKAGIDARRWGGFAFAIGLSRIATLKYRIQDLRTLTTPDLKILSQF
ncbi:phenylalanine--tRNA ligase subunit alpha [Candidatus Woesebacteria bacterium RIFCSPHIGHO2_02_FULL_38_9]|uniref:Phenylalanine--tRNA ligase alpha subunit n=1 Tax=Candidatus Woesebacteria bacterium RIFCSPHIGHO2_01_FULL_39_28 TaxID=1802496 RepID=A0A1F7YD10_9BACT|nr:MAG: phenylalanine--tRNA ligase subunit alpha [Candidatus Woesebacteria bacterium RIFCSPHIGHO2_01_FULL_39_28]OGM32399.1 MAG: phenylalanine--tRNA ligase subunit alpha [Candidatus Woesebacteria bacterium RIFCSPHIGHO2_02_FULL_38_9]OGM57896.1 MAG: phenylalanine--tRNA ligase subunit alpha [Candidatus Woesebacteria bacterium RIFCSPLOWO2_01_FULL_38_20]